MGRITKLTLLILFITALQGKTQDIILGAKLGIGKAKFTNQSNEEVLKGYTVSRAGVSLAFSPYFSKLQIISGGEYEISSLGNFFSIPFAARFIFGEKYKPFAEIGGYYSLALNAKQDDYLLKNNSGARIGIGMVYALNKRWRIEGGYFHRFGLTPSIEKEIELPGDQFDYDSYLMQGGNIEILIKYRF